jgi:hypothetical protein
MSSRVRLVAAFLFAVETLLVTGRVTRMPELQGTFVLRATIQRDAADGPNALPRDAAANPAA